ncbi:imidazole glycerol phosphate synthase subunit HisH [Mesorhizobium sp. SP-1A]|uniref:imidazole glycerol phosphate synthase subunit HisH n=1 Tax=Mesorhizobium sp. SP-1A TaxID=3077840 RepID=UPI0028F6DC40|nr:imidazole glycerol phosphate synthase subunit HisH [Mesorhizobium sp. SP-1A]
MISIVDYGIGNIGSIINMLKWIGHASRVVSTEREVMEAEALILPGVGAFGHGMRALSDRGLVEPIRRKALADKVPLLGICLGMQLLGSHSDEGNVDGLGLMNVRFRKFEAGANRLKVPHMGWNTVEVEQDSPLFDRSSDSQEQRFYFVHSYYGVCEDRTNLVASCSYGAPFAAVIGRGNILGCQFHPEKSHRFGASVLDKFARIKC